MFPRKLENLARRQIEFVAGITHELRTPLAVIRSAGENIADGLISDKTQLQKYGEVIRDEGRRLTDSVEQALQFAGVNSDAKKYSTKMENMTYDTLGQNIAFTNIHSNPIHHNLRRRIRTQDPKGYRFIYR